MSDLLDELDDREQEPEFGGDYSEWWDPDEDDRIVAVIAEIHNAPDKYTPEGEVPPPVYTLVALGEGDMEMGEAVSSRTHKQLLRGMQDAEVGDIVSITYDGYKKFEGSSNPSNAYRIGVIKADEIPDLDDTYETVIETVLEDYDGPTGNNRNLTPKGGDTSGSTQVDDTVLEAADFLKQILEMQGGEIGLDKAEKMVVEVREFDVDMDQVISLADAEVVDDTVTV